MKSCRNIERHGKNKRVTEEKKEGSVTMDTS